MRTRAASLAIRGEVPVSDGERAAVLKLVLPSCSKSMKDLAYDMTLTRPDLLAVVVKTLKPSLQKRTGLRLVAERLAARGGNFGYHDLLLVCEALGYPGDKKKSRPKRASKPS